jgi:hypothetical protein
MLQTDYTAVKFLEKSITEGRFRLLAGILEK